MTDDQLMELVKSGNQDALGQLFERHNKGLVRWLVSRCYRWDLAQDLAQETWIKIQQSTQLYFSVGRFVGYLHTTALRLLIDSRRKRQSLKFVNVEEEFLFDSLNPVEDGLEACMLSEQASRIEALLPELPEDQQMVFSLFVFCGLSLPEIAVQMDTCLATTKSRYRLAREKLFERVMTLGYAADLEIAEQVVRPSRVNVGYQGA